MLSPTARAAAVHSAAAGASGHGGGLTSTQSLPPMQRGDQVRRRVREWWGEAAYALCIAVTALSCASRACPADCSGGSAVLKCLCSGLPSWDGAEAASMLKVPRALPRLSHHPLPAAQDGIRAFRQPSQPIQPRPPSGPSASATPVTSPPQEGAPRLCAVRAAACAPGRAKGVVTHGCAEQCVLEGGERRSEPVFLVRHTASARVAVVGVCVLRRCTRPRRVSASAHGRGGTR